MKNILHQSLKDLRLLRWLLAAWVLALAAAHGALLYSATLRAEAVENSLVASASFQATIGMIGAAILIVIAALLVQHDSPVSATAFWLTRPMPPATMLATKLLVAFVVVALLPATVEVLDYVVAGIGLQWPPPYRVPLQLAWFLPVMAIAAVTADLPQFVLVALVEVALLTAANALATAFGLKPAVNSHFDVFLTVAALASACVLAWQYLARRRTAAAVFLAVAPFAITLGIDLWPWAKPVVDVYPEEKRKAISIVADRAAITSVMRAGDLVIRIPLTISGTPANTRLTAVPGSTRVWLQQGRSRTRLDVGIPFDAVRAQPEAEQAPPWAPDDPRALDVARRYESALAGTALLNAQVVATSGMHPVITFFVKEANLPRLAGTTRIEFDVQVQEYGAWPGVGAVAGARYDAPACRGTIDATLSLARRIDLDLREAGSGWRTIEWLSTTWLLRNRTAGQSLVAVPLSPRVRSNYGEAGMVLPLAPSLALRWRTVNFSHARLMGGASLFASDEEAGRWLKDAELVFVPVHNAGQFHVALELADVRIEGR